MTVLDSHEGRAVMRAERGSPHHMPSCGEPVRQHQRGLDILSRLLPLRSIKSTQNRDQLLQPTPSPIPRDSL